MPYAQESPIEQPARHIPGEETEMPCPYCLRKNSGEHFLIETPGGAWQCPRCGNGYPDGEWAMEYAELINIMLDERGALRSELAALKAENARMRRALEAMPPFLEGCALAAHEGLRAPA